MLGQSYEEIGGRVRTAISVEVRDGRLCIFMPPTAALEDYLDLIASADALAWGNASLEGLGRYPDDPLWRALLAGVANAADDHASAAVTPARPVNGSSRP